MTLVFEIMYAAKDQLKGIGEINVSKTGVFIQIPNKVIEHHYKTLKFSDCIRIISNFPS